MSAAAPGAPALPARLAAVVEDFQGLAEQQRLELLLDFANDLPPLPDHLAASSSLLEAVPECQSPVFVRADVEPGDDVPVVRVYAKAPREAPTTRGFAAILVETLDEVSVPEVLAVPLDVGRSLGLDRAVSPLRLRGLEGMIVRLQRQTADKVRALSDG